MTARTAALVVVLSVPAFAQVRVSIDIPLPTITFVAPPPLVVVQPGVQVVEDNDDEIFFVDGYYWHRRDGHWFRTHDHRGQWVLVENRVVPGTIVALPPGQYRRWKKGRPAVVVPMPVPPSPQSDNGKHRGKKH